MTEESFKRKLTAILSADVEGYSRLMGEDEDATIRTLTAYRELMSTLIQKHRGRVVDSPGDNLLAEFLSVVDGVRCAVEIQEELRVRNAELPENRRMQFRIGINLGDVVEEEERIYGDGINIAARVEGLAEGGGICISGAVYDSIKNKLTLSYESLGEHTVKNIKEPVRVYRMRVGPEAAAPVVREEKVGLRRWRWAAIGAVAVLIIVAGVLAIWNFYFRTDFKPVSVDTMALPLPDKPSIAVLPFDNLSGDPEQDYIADGISENIISALSKIPEMFVIARNSTFTYKNKAVKVQQISEELGVRYILEGSVQKSGEKIRINAQLIDAIKGHHLWSEQYERVLEDFFDLLDEITKKIAVALQVKLTHGDIAGIWHRSTDNFKAWGYATKGYSSFLRFAKQDNVKARDLFKQAVQLDPNYAFAWTFLAWTYIVDLRFAWSDSPGDDIKRAIEIAEKSMKLDDSSPNIYSFWNTVYMIQRQFDKALAAGKKAIALGPNDPNSHVLLAQTKLFLGRFEEAIGLVKKANRLTPYYPALHLAMLGKAQTMAKHYEDAIKTSELLLKRARKGEYSALRPHLALTQIYIEMGQKDKARTHASEVMRIDPSFSLDKFRKQHFFKDPIHLERIVKALCNAGLPEKPSLPLPDKPSIAVLPFVNLSGDPEQEYFSDGITEEIITALSKTPNLFVIARTSSFKYKGKEVDVRRVGRELGVRYVLEGSVRKAGDKVRITAQLIDAKTNSHIWAERYDRELEDIFELQDEIMRNILVEMRVQLTDGVQARLYMKKFQEKKIGIEVFDKQLQSLWHFYRMNPEGFSMARQLAEEAIEIDPNYAPPYTVLAFIHLLDIRAGRSKSPRKSMELAEKFAQKALQLDDSHPMTCITLGQIHLYKRQHEKAIAEGKKALALCPNCADVHSHLGYFLYYAGRYEEAIPLYERAMRLNPYPPIFYYHRLASAYANVGRYDEAIDLCKKTLKRAPNYTTARLVLAMVYIWQGLEEEARAEAAEFLRIKPSFTLKRMKAISLHKNKDDLKRRIEALRKAGLPE